MIAIAQQPAQQIELFELARWDTDVGSEGVVAVAIVVGAEALFAAIQYGVALGSKINVGTLKPRKHIRAVGVLVRASRGTHVAG